MSKLSVAAGCVAAVLLVSGPSSADTPGSDYHGVHMWGGGHGWFFGPIMMLLFLAVLVTVVVVLLRWMRSGGSGNPSPRETNTPPGLSPVDILKERFARGEIDEKEFESRRQILQG